MLFLPCSYCAMVPRGFSCQRHSSPYSIRSHVTSLQGPCLLLLALLVILLPNSLCKDSIFSLLHFDDIFSDVVATQKRGSPRIPKLPKFPKSSQRANENFGLTLGMGMGLGWFWLWVNFGLSLGSLGVLGKSRKKKKKEANLKSHPLRDKIDGRIETAFQRSVESNPFSRE